MEKPVKPISPKEIMGDLEEIIPPAIIQAVNNLLKKKYRGSTVSIKQEEIVKEAIRIDSSLTSAKIYDNKWMDFEPIFRKSGWIVSYDKPGWDENYDAFFQFKPKKNKTPR